MSEGSKLSLEQILDEVEGKETAPTATETSESNAAASTGNALTSMLSSPQLMQMMGSLPALFSAASKPTEGGEKTADKDKDTPNARALLCALRPYLGEHRRTTIDGILQLLQWRSILQALPLQQLLRKEQR